jgi:hypothetical protein
MEGKFPGREREKYREILKGLFLFLLRIINDNNNNTKIVPLM